LKLDVHKNAQKVTTLSSSINISVLLKLSFYFLVTILLKGQLKIGHRSPSSQEAKMEEMRSNRYKFHQERFHLDISNNLIVFFTVRVIIHWNNLPSNADLFTMWLDSVLDNLI